MAVKCTECGASIQDDSKFCKYCGAKINQGNVKKIEVKFDNTAEIKRAEYEEKESQLRQKKMERELRKEKRKPYVIAAKVLSVLIPFAISFLWRGDGVMTISFIIVSALILGIYIVKFLDKK